MRPDMSDGVISGGSDLGGRLAALVEEDLKSDLTNWFHTGLREELRRSLPEDLGELLLKNVANDSSYLVSPPEFAVA